MSDPEIVHSGDNSSRVTTETESTTVRSVGGENITEIRSETRTITETTTVHSVVSETASTDAEQFTTFNTNGTLIVEAVPAMASYGNSASDDESFAETYSAQAISSQVTDLRNEVMSPDTFQTPPESPFCNGLLNGGPLLDSQEDATNAENLSEPSVAETNAGDDKVESEIFETSQESGVSQTVQESGVSQIVEETGVSQTVQETGVSHTVQETGVSQTVQETGVSQTVQETGVSQTVQETGVSQTVQETGVSQTVQETGVSESVEETCSSQISQEMGASHTVYEIGAKMETTVSQTTQELSTKLESQTETAEQKEPNITETIQTAQEPEAEIGTKANNSELERDTKVEAEPAPLVPEAHLESQPKRLDPISNDLPSSQCETNTEVKSEFQSVSAESATSEQKASKETLSQSSGGSRRSIDTSQMFKVTKFEAKSFSDVQQSFSLSSILNSSSFGTSEEMSSHASSFSSSTLESSSVSSSYSEQITQCASSAESQRVNLVSDVSATPAVNGLVNGDADQTHPSVSMGVLPTDECKDGRFNFNPKVYNPPPEADMDFSDFPRKKKMFASSSFYEEPNAIYPTVEEQVELCRKIADSLSDDTNKKSKGANMFFKRVKRAEKWVTESEGTCETEYTQNMSYVEPATPDPSSIPYIRVSKGPPQLKLILDPRHLLDMKRLRQEGMNIVEHNAVSPEICLDLVRDLNSPTGRGALLFAKRKKKSEEWVVDEEKVKALLSHRYDNYTPEPPFIPRNMPIEPLVHPRVTMIKTPWAAAMESPSGSCIGAFKQLRPDEVAESVIKAAETKVMTYPSPLRPVIEPVFRSEAQQPTTAQFYQPPAAVPPAPLPAAPPRAPATPSPSFRTGVYTADPYKPRAPRGWGGTSSVSSQFTPMAPGFYASQAPQSQLAPVAQGIYASQVPQSQPAPAAQGIYASQAPQLQLVSVAPPVAYPAAPPPAISQLPQQPPPRTYNFTNFNITPKAWSEMATQYQPIHFKPVKPPSVLVQ